MTNIHEIGWGSFNAQVVDQSTPGPVFVWLKHPDDGANTVVADALIAQPDLISTMVAVVGHPPVDLLGSAGSAFPAALGDVDLPVVMVVSDRRMAGLWEEAEHNLDLAEWITAKLAYLDPGDDPFPDPAPVADDGEDDTNLDAGVVGEALRVQVMLPQPAIEGVTRAVRDALAQLEDAAHQSWDAMIGVLTAATMTAEDALAEATARHGDAVAALDAAREQARAARDNWASVHQLTVLE